MHTVKRTVTMKFLPFALLFLIATVAFATSRATSLASDTKLTMVALQMYADDHQGRLPIRLGELIPRYLSEDRTFPGTILISPPGALLASLPPGSPVLVTNRLYPDGALAVAYVDGSVMTVRPTVLPIPPTRNGPPLTFILILVAVVGWGAALTQWIKSRARPNVA